MTWSYFVWSSLKMIHLVTRKYEYLCFLWNSHQYLQISFVQAISSHVSQNKRKFYHGGILARTPKQITVKDFQFYLILHFIITQKERNAWFFLSKKINEYQKQQQKNDVIPIQWNTITILKWMKGNGYSTLEIYLAVSTKTEYMLYWVVSPFWLMWILLLWTHVYMDLFEYQFSIFWIYI